jgi:hypothetical protein
MGAVGERGACRRHLRLAIARTARGIVGDEAGAKCGSNKATNMIETAYPVTP